MKSIVEEFDQIALRLRQIEQQKAAARADDKVKVAESPSVGEIVWPAVVDFDCFG